MSLSRTYRGVELTPNFTSIHGTCQALKSQRGWNIYLPGYGSLGWFSSVKKAQFSIDSMHAGNCNDRIKKILAAFA